MAETDSSLVLTTPSASRVFRSRSGGPAKVRQKFEVQTGAFLEFYPEPFIPRAGALYHQQTELHLAAGGRLLFFDWLTPGRVASGEVFLYSALSWSLDVFFDSKLVARERYRLTPQDTSLEALRLLHPQAHYLSCYFIGTETLPIVELEALSNSEVYLGHAPLISGGFTIKALCQDSLAARRLMKQLRAVLYTELQRPPPSLGRYL